jgi:TonB family protein
MEMLRNAKRFIYVTVVCNAMKRQVLTILLIVFASYSFCQDVKKIEKKFDNSKQISESFYVLKSDKNIKHGEYILYFRYSDNDESLIKNGIKKKDDFIKERGNYINGKKDGVWIEFVNKTEMDSGKYSNGKKVGIWDTYNGNEKVKSFDYDNNKKIGIWLTYKEKGMVTERYDYDNNIQLEPFIRFNISYPNIAQENGIQGTVKIRFHINIDCTIDNISIVQSLSPECDKAAIDAMKKYGELYKKYSKNCVDRSEEQDINFRLY